MKNNNKRILTLMLTLLPACSVLATQQVTNNLLTAFVYQNEQAKTFSLSERMQHYKVPAVSIAVIDNGKIAWSQAFGVKESGATDKVSTETLFQAGSISKPMAAVLAMQQAQQGKLDLDKPINQQLTSWKLEGDGADKVKIADLLSHSADVAVHGFAGYSKDEKFPPLIDVLNGKGNSGKIQVNNFPNANWAYSGGGYTVLQQAIIDNSEQDFTTLAKQNIFKPLNMQHSSFSQQDIDKQFDNIALAHVNGQEISSGWHRYPELAAAGLWSTPTDLATLMISIQASLAGEEDQLLSPKSALKIVSPIRDFVGQGVFLTLDGKNSYFSHSGVNQGFEAHFVAYNHLGKGAVVMTNGQGGDQLAQEVLRAVATVYQWPSHYLDQRTSVQRLSSKQLTELVGNYRFDNGFNMRVSTRDARLFGQGDGQSEYEFHAINNSELVMMAFGGKFKLKRNKQGKLLGIEQFFQGSWHLAKKVG